MMKLFVKMLTTSPWNGFLLLGVIIVWNGSMVIWEHYEYEQYKATRHICYRPPNPEQKAHIARYLIRFTKQPNSQLEKRALKLIPQLGKDAKEILPELNEVALTHDDTDIQRLARKAIWEINIDEHFPQYSTVTPFE